MLFIFNQKSGNSSGNSLAELPDNGTSIHRTPEKVTEPDINTSHLSCSPFSSPLNEITQEFNRSINLGEEIERSRKDSFLENTTKQWRNKENELSKDLENRVEHSGKDSIKTYSTSKEVELKNKVMNNLKIRSDLFKKIEDDDDEVTFIGSIHAEGGSGKNLKVVDDDVTIVEMKPEIIALSSDDEEEVRCLILFVLI